MLAAGSLASGGRDLHEATSGQAVNTTDGFVPGEIR